MTIHVARVVREDIGELVESWIEYAHALFPHFVMPADAGQWKRVLADPSIWWYSARDGRSLVAVAVLARVTGPPWSSAEVGVGVLPPFRGCGIGTATLRALFAAELGEMLARIEALVDPANTHSMRMVEAAGMEMEGVSRSVVHVGDCRADLARWAVTAG